MTTTAIRATPADRRTIASRARDELARRARASLAVFVRQAIKAGVVQGITGRQLVWGRHLEAVCFHTQMQLEAWLVANGHGTPEMIERQRAAWESTGATWEDGAPEPWLRYILVQNQLYNLPPGTLKSTIVMVLACAWIWLHCPRFAWGAASGIDANVTRDSSATQDVVESAWYRETFGVTWTIRKDREAISEWATTAGGVRYSRTVQRGFTGLHVDGVFIDDPDDADKVWNEAARVAPQNRFTRAIENRVNDEQRSIRLVMQQVVHVDGFSAYLLSVKRWSPATPKGWAQLCIAAEFGFQPEDAPTITPYGWSDWRTAKGELMDPVRLSAAVLADKRESLGTNGYEAQYNQNARALGSGMFARQFTRFFVLEGTNIATLRRRPDGCPSRADQPPIVIKLSDLDRITLSVDAANSVNPDPKKKVSAVGLLVAGCMGDGRFVLDDRTRVLGPSTTYLAIYEIIRAWPLERILVEVKAMGPSVIDEISRSIRRGWYLDEAGTKVPLLGPDGTRTRAIVTLFDPGKDSKPQRWQGMVPGWERGEYFFLDGASWLYPQVDENRKTVDEGCIGEICTAPASRRTDRLDSLSQLATHYRGSSDVWDRWKALTRG